MIGDEGSAEDVRHSEEFLRRTKEGPKTGGGRVGKGKGGLDCFGWFGFFWFVWVCLVGG